MSFLRSVVLVNTLVLFCSSVAAQEKTPPAPKAEATPSKPSGEEGREGRYKRFAERLNQVKLVGRFTVLGKDGPLAKDEYTINKVEKLPEGEKWMFHCRIKYGDHDVAVPLPIDVEWAGETPVITLDNLTIPGLGTFGSRVVLHDNMYAGTWRHDKVGGHLFGTIVKIEESDETSNTQTPVEAKKSKKGDAGKGK